MLARKYRSVLLLLLTCTSSLAAANTLTEHKHEEHQAGTLLSSRDLEQRLRRFFRYDLLVHKFLDRVFIPQVPAYDLPITGTPFSSYIGKKVDSIILHKHGGWSRPDSWWRSILYSITPLTSDKIIWEQLCIVEGDRLKPQELLQSEAHLAKLPSISQANITVKEHPNNTDAVDIHITTQDQLPITWALNPLGLSTSLGYNNLLGWGYKLESQLWLQQGLAYGVKYNAPNIEGSGITSELKYHQAPQKKVRSFSAFRKFGSQFHYAGALKLGYTKLDRERLLDGSIQPQLTTWSFHHGSSWLGKAWGKEQVAGQLIVTSGVFQQRFTQRPAVASHLNRYFHHYVLGAGSVGFVHKYYYKDQWIDGMGDVEYISYGSKINLIGGYQFGEFVSRPYMRLSLAQGGRLLSLGHWHSVAAISGFWHGGAVEQGILKLHLRHFTPLLKLGHHSMRQFINLGYLGGFNLFTGELIGTNTHEVSPKLVDPFLGGTQRFQLSLETVVFSSVHLAGCQVAALSFVEAVRLQDAQGKVRQRSFCKALGIGFRCAHPRWRLGVLQVKVSYQPLIQGIGLEIGRGKQGCLEDFDIGAPDTTAFQEY